MRNWTLSWSGTLLFISLFNKTVHCVHFITKSKNVLIKVNHVWHYLKKKKKIKKHKKSIYTSHVEKKTKKKNKAFSPIWTAMKRSLRQDAEHGNPKLDLGWSLFSSGVCWHLPVPSAIIKKTSVSPPKIVGSLSQASFSTGHEDPWLHLHTPWVCSESPSPSRRFYAGRLSFLPFNTEEERRYTLFIAPAPHM